MIYTQCKLREIAYIPQKFAIVGKYLKINQIDGWAVEEVYGSLEEEIINKQNIATHRGTFKDTEWIRKS